MKNLVFTSTGRRKSSVARVVLNTKGEGIIKVNNSFLVTYFKRAAHRMLVTQPLNINVFKIYNINCNVLGGGKSGQAHAISHAISKIIKGINNNHYILLKKNSFLTRDCRRVERKKYGQPKARKKFQFSKR